MRCPRCAKQLFWASTCRACGWQRRPPPYAALPPTFLTSADTPGDDLPPYNTSGTGLPTPPEVREMGYCWGALGLPFWWCVANQVPYGCGGGGLWWLWIARDGHELAWQHRRFHSFRHFQDTMRVWNRWGKALLALHGLVLLVCLGSAALSLTAFRSFEQSFAPYDESQLAAERCQENVRQLAHAMRAYCADTGGRLPPAVAWQARLERYQASEYTWPCRADGLYASNCWLAGRWLNGFRRPEQTVYLYEWDGVSTVAYPHQGRMTLGFVDGHAALSAPSGLRQWRWGGPVPH